MNKDEFKDIIMPQVQEAIYESFVNIKGLNLTNKDLEQVTDILYNNLMRIVPKIEANIACYKDHVDILVGPAGKIDLINANIRVTFR